MEKPRSHSPNSKEISQEEIIVPKQTARALGTGLQQLLAEQIKACGTKINSLTQVESVPEMQQSLDKFITILNNLESPGMEVRISPLLSGWTFKFSEVGKIESQPIPPVIVIDEGSTPKAKQLILAMQHDLNNALTPLFGFSEALETTEGKVSKDPNSLHSNVKTMNAKLQPILNPVNQLKILTFQNGNTAIVPIPPPPGHPRIAMSPQ